MKFEISFIVALCFIAQAWCAVLPPSNDLFEDPNSIYNYMTKETVDRLEERYSSNLQISWDVNKVFYKLWTRESGFSNPFVFNHETAPEQLRDNNFDPTRATKIIAHGFTDSVSFAEPFAQAYIENFDHDVNIIGIDWSELSAHNGLPNYFAAASNSIKVGEHTGHLFAKMLIGSLGVHANSIHAIGHSLGAHLVGHLGRTIESDVKEKIIRITGLDPAAPWYEQTKEEHRLSKDDADFVDVIHTNSGLLIKGGLSFMQNLGHIDFYPNGGRHQPGCTGLCIGKQNTFCIPGNNDGISIVDWLKGGCSHGRSHEYYVESITAMVETAYPFLGQFCQDWNDFVQGVCIHLQGEVFPMGEHARPASSPVKQSLSKGIIPGLFLKTNKEAPFSLTH